MKYYLYVVKRNGDYCDPYVHAGSIVDLVIECGNNSEKLVFAIEISKEEYQKGKSDL